MATMLSQKLVEAQEANDTVKWFIRRFEIGKLLHICRANKAKGFSKEFEEYIHNKLMI